MNEQDRIILVRSVARLAAAETRAAAIGELSSFLGIECVLFFTADTEVQTMLVAPGFSQTLPEGESWRAFLAACVERHPYTASLSFPKPGDKKSVTGLAWETSAVLALVGPPPAAEILSELALLLPLLAATLRHEQGLLVHASRARLAGQMTKESTALIKGLDDARRAAQQEITARKTAEKAVKLVSDELQRANLELTRARDQAIAASCAKDDFLAALSHELRTPLNPVLLIASEAAENPDLPAAVRRDFATIAKNAQLEARLIDDLLDLTRITRGKMSLDKQRLDLRPILEDAIEIVRADLEAKHIQFVATLDAREHPVMCDPARLQQVFWNVLKNAVKFTPAGGRIRVETQLDDLTGEIVIAFADTGIGMTPPELARVFESFSQGDHASSSAGSHRFGGLGLGLAISRTLLQLHAGNIEATSAGNGKGATFTVRLPLDTSCAAKTTTPARASFETSPPTQEVRAPTRVLLVEDHEATSAALVRLLQRRNFEVVAAASVAEALHAAEAGKFDLVISDIGLPDGDGHTLMTSLAQQHGLPGIAMTGYGMNEDIVRSEAAGFTTHVTKPVSVRALETALEIVRRAEPATRSRRDAH